MPLEPVARRPISRCSIYPVSKSEMSRHSSVRRDIGSKDILHFRQVSFTSGFTMKVFENVRIKL